MLAEMRRMNLPLQDYQEPSCFDYYLNYPSENSSRFPLGNILLFRRRGGSPISDQTLRTVESLERFFIFSFTSLKARYFYHHVGAAIFNWSVVGIKSELKLTNREFQVFIYRLYGLTFKQIAAELFISHATVRKHLQSLLRKGNARNAIEMFTRRFLQGAENVLAGGKDGLSEMAKPETEGEGDILLW